VANLSALLEVQALDLAGDQLLRRRDTLPEHARLEEIQAQRAPLDAVYAELLARREQRGVAERALAQEVAALAARIQEAEDTLYSGSVRAPKELTGLQEEIRSLRGRQAELEDREMALLEEIERDEREMAENRAALEASRSEAARLEDALHAAQAEIDAELARLTERRHPMTSDIPAPVLVEYERLRTRPRLAGRAAAPLAAGSCGGCHVKLPVMEYSRLKAEPEDVAPCCSHCGRLLVR
jgi:predicted  nucleic acid-binding Zn-ribbon protein